MKHLRPIRPARLALLLVLAGMPRHGHAGEAAAAEHGGSVSTHHAQLEPGPVLDPGALDPGWRALFEELGRERTVFARFTEHRWFAVRKQPVVLRGELRRSPEHGLSLRYLEPEPQLMIIDDAGIVLRNAAGRSRAIKADSRAPQVDALLLPVLRFDLEALHARFEIRGAREGGRWRLDFTPRAADLARTMGQLTVQGDSGAVRRLGFSRGQKQRVEVHLEDAREGVDFPADEVRRFFR